MNEYSIDDFLHDSLKDMHDLLGEPQQRPLSGPSRVYGVEDQFNGDLEYPTLKRLEGRVLSIEVKERLKYFNGKIEECKKRGHHDVDFVYSSSIEGKDYIVGLCSSCSVIVAKEETDSIREKIAEYYRSQERLLHRSIF